MKLLTFIFLVSSFNVFAQGPYAPDANTLGTTAMHKDSSAFIDWASASIIQRGWRNIADTTLGITTTGNNLSATDKSGVNGVVSLGDGGSAILTFSSPILNGSGPDFAVFENAFDNTFLELAHVEVSSDGVNFFRFESISLSQDTTQINNVIYTTNLYNLAGKFRAQYGTPFDLEELNGTTGLDVNNITHVKIIDVVGSINEAYSTYDSQGNIINDPFPTPFETGGFDLDAIGVIHSLVGIEELETTFRIYPNPASDKVTVVFNNQSEKSIEIIDFKGVTIQTISAKSNQIELDLSKYAKGIYFIKTTVNNSISVEKLVVN